jgi:polygalacturonase
MNFTLERVNIHHVIDQIHIIGDNVLVKDSWLHSNLHYTRDPSRPDGGPSHDDNVQIQKGNNIRLLNNTMASSHTASVIVTQDAGTVGNVHIESNHFSNGGCSLNLVEKERGALRGFVIKNNVFTRTQSTPGCAVRMTSTSLPFLTQSNNTWNDGAPVSVISAGKY